MDTKSMSAMLKLPEQNPTSDENPMSHGSDSDCEPDGASSNGKNFQENFITQS